MLRSITVSEGRQKELSAQACPEGGKNTSWEKQTNQEKFLRHCLLSTVCLTNVNTSSLRPWTDSLLFFLAKDYWSVPLLGTTLDYMTNAQERRSLETREQELASSSWILKLFQGGESSTSFWTNVGEIKCSLSTSSHKPGIQESMFSVSNIFIQSGHIGSLLPMAQKPTPVRASLLSLFLQLS